MSDYNRNGKFPQREKNAADTREITLYGVAPKQGERAATMVFSCFNNAPRFKIYRPNDQKPLDLKLDMMGLAEVLRSVEELSRSREPNQYRWALDGFVAPGKKGVVGTLIAGRDDKGVLYMGATSYGWEKPERFNFRPYRFFKRVDREGNPVPEHEVSAVLARAWANLINDIAIEVFTKEYKHPEPKQQNGQGGYNNNRGNNGGGYNQGGNSGNAEPQQENFSQDDDYI